MAVRTMKAKSIKPKRTRAKYTVKDHLTAYLVLVVIVAVIVIGGVALYMTGIFAPVQAEPALQDTEPLDLATPPPTRGFIDWLIPSARAEEADEAETTDTPEEAGEAQDTEGAARPQSEDELEQLLAEIVAGEVDEDAEIPESEQITVDKNDLAVNPNLPDDIYNVLLLATDNRGGNAHTGRTDVMIIASVNKTTNEVKLASLSRDLYVPIPGGTSNKLNAAHAYGGPNLAMKTVNSVFEMNIQDYVVVDFYTMTAIVDSFGGVDIYLEPMEYYYINYNVAVSEDYEGFAKSTTRYPLTVDDQETVVHLDGLQAVSYARIRKLDNDFQRGSRQRVLLNAIMEKAMSNLSASTFYGLATSMINSTSTNITLAKVIEVGTWLLSAENVTLNELAIPIPGSYRGAVEKDIDVVVFNQEQNVTQLHGFLFGDYIPASGT